ncbi:hypothetical protein [Tranquillimonas alkanivorans]|uniref:Uncharacterized protein n=1 Tax=Tranquillimonas alkanivorans TaxID=441119 RepID=A0A1I5TTM8_9RHOB|nr:hypothetical protein [Tranquillimonas alkanivorans]SFP86420.1 hypothetical protein SAMN04488047_11523 [Tranquillimonas alkanivorans]
MTQARIALRSGIRSFTLTTLVGCQAYLIAIYLLGAAVAIQMFSFMAFAAAVLAYMRLRQL